MPSKKAVPPAPMKKSALLKLKLKSLLGKFPSKKSLKEKAYSTLSLLLIFSSLGYMVTRVPALHSAFLRAKVGSKTYMIRGTPTSGGGTGFEVQAPSGQSYIVTNSHVCDGVKDLTEDKNSVLVMDDDGNYMPRRILEISDKTDLCLIESIPNVQGLSLGNEPGIGTDVTVVGHPLLRPLTLSNGEIVGVEDVKILDFIVATGNPLIDMFLPVGDGKCNKPKNEFIEIPVPELGATIKACFVITKGAYMSSVEIFPGNSGSPAVDWMGRVIGVAFAANPEDKKGDLVSLKDLKAFLARY